MAAPEPTVEQLLVRIEERLAKVEACVDELEGHYRRRWLRFIPYTILAIGMGVALLLVSNSASSGQLSAEREQRLQQDCRSRVEARDVLRDVVTQAYTPPPGTSTERTQFIERLRDDVLRKVPELRCTTKAGIPIPEPVSTNTTEHP